MPYRYDVHPGCCVHVVFTGRLTNRELMAYFAAVKRDPSAAGEPTRLIDLRKVSRVPSSGALRGLAHVLCRETTEPVRRAFLLSNHFDHSAFQIFEAASAGCPGTNRAFLSLAEAAEWLGITPPVETA